MKKILSTSLTLLLLLMPAVVFGQETGQALTVRVVTPDGLPKQGLTVTAEAQGFRETVVTNSTLCCFQTAAARPPMTWLF
jgi:hypothetical protein